MIGEIGIQAYCAFDYEDISISANSSATLNAGKADASREVMITCEGVDVRYRFDGGNPSANSGHLLKVDAVLRISGVANVKKLKFFNPSSITTATLRVTYLK